MSSNRSRNYSHWVSFPTKFESKIQEVVTLFSKLRPTEKDRLVCNVLQSRQFYDSFKLTERDDITKDIFHLSDAVRDKKNFDVKKIENITTNQHGWQYRKN